jgi:hypothetical protein
MGLLCSVDMTHYFKTQWAIIYHSLRSVHNWPQIETGYLALILRFLPATAIPCFKLEQEGTYFLTMLRLSWWLLLRRWLLLGLYGNYFASCFKQLRLDFVHQAP